MPSLVLLSKSERFFRLAAPLIMLCHAASFILNINYDFDYVVNLNCNYAIAN